jgi:hypothetical protein
MGTLSILITAFAFIVVLRLIFRKILDFPSYTGELFADSSEFKDLMPESSFWQIIQDVRKNSNKNYNVQCQLLVDTLATLPGEEIIRFDRTFATLMAKSYSFNLWEAAYALNGGCSDDCFEYFRSWLIGQGKNKFYWTIKYPRLLFLFGVKEMVENYEGLSYCVHEAYQNKLGRELPNRDDIFYGDGGRMFNEGLAFFRYPELALLAW